MKKNMPLEGLRWSRDSGSALYDTPQTAVLGRAGGEFWKHIIDGINLTHHLQQEEKSGKRKIARCTILKLVDGGQTKPRKLGNLLLGESRLQMTQIRPSLYPRT